MLWRLKSSGMWHCVTGLVVPDILKECWTHIFKAKQSEKNIQCAVLIGWLDPQKLRPYTHPKCWKSFIQWHSVTSKDFNFNKSTHSKCCSLEFPDPRYKLCCWRGWDYILKKFNWNMKWWRIFKIYTFSSEKASFYVNDNVNLSMLVSVQHAFIIALWVL